MDLTKISLEMAKISPNIKNLVGQCSISQSYWVSLSFGRRSETEPTVSAYRELDPPPTTGVVGSAGGRPRSYQIYKVGQATGWVGQP